MMFTSFLKDQKGMAAVEFGLILPVLAILLIGSVTAFDTYKSDRATSITANTIVDLVSRQPEMNDTIRDNLFAAGQGLIAPYGSASSLGISISSISFNGTDLVVDWSEANANGNILTDGGIASLDLPNIPENESVIFVRVENNYAPIFGSGLEFSRETSRRPRFVPIIAYDTAP